MTSFDNFINELFSKGMNNMQSESDIISSYIDGKITKEEYIRRMNEQRGNRRSG